MNNSNKIVTHYVENGNYYTQVIEYITDDEHPNAVDGGKVIVSVCSPMFDFVPTTVNLKQYFDKHKDATLASIPMREGVSVITNDEYKSHLSKVDPHRLVSMGTPLNPQRVDLKQHYDYMAEQKAISANRETTKAQVKAVDAEIKAAKKRK